MARPFARFAERSTAFADGLGYQPFPYGWHRDTAADLLSNPGRPALGRKADHRSSCSGHPGASNGSPSDLGLLGLRDRLGRLERPPIARGEPHRQPARRQIHQPRQPAPDGARQSSGSGFLRRSSVLRQTGTGPPPNYGPAGHARHYRRDGPAAPHFAHFAGRGSLIFALVLAAFGGSRCSRLPGRNSFRDARLLHAVSHDARAPRTRLFAHAGRQ